MKYYNVKVRTYPSHSDYFRVSTIKSRYTKRKIFFPVVALIHKLYVSTRQKVSSSKTHLLHTESNRKVTISCFIFHYLVIFHYSPYGFLYFILISVLYVSKGLNLTSKGLRLFWVIFYVIFYFTVYSSSLSLKSYRDIQKKIEYFILIVFLTLTKIDENLLM